ncbi:hypothetical protein GIB67_022542 [Kingdonia uniflora]|uniref:Uncharacterized protein n=1 Tax=Kingdonia uniflora TaxID=39325 RepID=A0A7J7L7J3_9MAGN|nr:hypothetical protein GIB67_022542 [Kingdonia uniflora]
MEWVGTVWMTERIAETAYRNMVGKVPRIKNFGNPMIENDFEDIVGCQNVIRMNSNALA